MATGTSISNFLETELVDHVFGAAAYSAPATLYFALFTAAPSDAGGGTEVSGGSYARVAVTNNATNFPAGNPKSNGVAIDFGTATANWGTVTHVGVFDAASGGNLLVWGALENPKTIDNGDGAAFAIGEFTLTLD